jgi:hypothetical protein
VSVGGIAGGEGATLRAYASCTPATVGLEVPAHSDGPPKVLGIIIRSANINHIRSKLVFNTKMWLSRIAGVRCG